MHIAKLERVKRVKSWEAFVFFLFFFFGALRSGRTNWFVPSSGRSAVGRRTRRFGGRWCDRGTCLPHSHPLSAAQIYFHSLLFSGEPPCQAFVVAGARDCWQNNIYSLKVSRVAPLQSLPPFCFIPSWRSVPVEQQLPGRRRTDSTSVECCDQ